MWRIVAGGCPGDSGMNLPDSSSTTGRETLDWSPTPREVEQRAYAMNRGRADPMPSAVNLGAKRFSKHLLKAIDKCMALYPEDRVQNCDEFRKLLRTQVDSEVTESKESLTRHSTHDNHVVATDVQQGTNLREFLLGEKTPAWITLTIFLIAIVLMAIMSIG